MGFSDTGENCEAQASSDIFSRSRQRPAWLDFSNLRDGFFPLGFPVVESRILPLAILLPIKLISYILSVVFEVLPVQLLNGTAYFKCLEELALYTPIQRSKSQAYNT